MSRRTYEYERRWSVTERSYEEMASDLEKRMGVELRKLPHLPVEVWDEIIQKALNPDFSETIERIEEANKRIIKSGRDMIVNK